LALNGRVPPVAKSAYLKLREMNAGQCALPDFLIIGAQKAGTTRSGQEYQEPLLVLDGETYAQLSIDALYEQVLQLISATKTGNF
jgi:hypothetical protein